MKKHCLRKNLSYKLLSLFLLAGCHSVSDHILNDFKKVNASIDRSNKKLGNESSLDLYYTEIKGKRDQNNAWVKNADSVYGATRHAIGMIDSINQKLGYKDFIGNNAEIAGKLLIHTREGDSLVRALSQVYDHCRSGLISLSKRPGLDSALSRINDARSQKNWLERNFKDTSSVGAMTILTYVRMECLKAATMTLADIERSLN